MKIRQLSKLVACVAAVGFAMGFATSASASAFQLWELGGNIGVGHAGDAAYASDASTSYSNPAGLVRLHHIQVAGGLVAIHTSVKYTGTTTAGTYDETGTDQGGDTNFIPNGHVAVPINNRMAFGLSVVAPLGLDTHFSDTSKVRAMATKSQLQGIEINPNLGVKINDHLSVGAGLDIERLTASFDQKPFGTGTFDNHLTGWGYGYNLGVLYQFTPSTRVGLTYRSKIDHNDTGTSTFKYSIFDLSSNNVSTTLILPATTTLSIFQQLTPKWAWLASVVYTRWSQFKELILKNSAVGNVDVHQGFRDTWNLEFGGMYNVTPKWRLEAGMGYDQSPVTTTYRTVQVPDTNRFSISLGAHWQPTDALGVEIGYAHFFINRASINDSLTVLGNTTTTVGYADSSADNFGVQVTYKFL